MLFIVDIPPVTEAQEARYEYFQELNENLYVTGQEKESQALVFLKQANFLKMLAETQGDIRPTAESLAISNYLAYLRYMEKAGE